jgi:hypothetical protein
MHWRAFLVLSAVVVAGCAKKIPPSDRAAAGTPYVSWIVMRGDRDNPDAEFVCQSDPRNDCVLPASREDAQVFSDVHFYYHNAGVETAYVGSIDIGFFQGAGASRQVQTALKVRKGERISNQSVSGIVRSDPGSSEITFALVGTVAETGVSQPIRQVVPVVVK